MCKKSVPTISHDIQISDYRLLFCLFWYIPISFWNTSETSGMASIVSQVICSASSDNAVISFSVQFL